MNTQEPCQPSTTNPSSPDEFFAECKRFYDEVYDWPDEDAYSIQGNTIDRDPKQNGGGISRNQSHTLNSTDRHAVCAAAVDCRNATESPFVNGTLQAKEQGSSLNLNNVVRVPNP